MIFGYKATSNWFLSSNFQLGAPDCAAMFLSHFFGRSRRLNWGQQRIRCAQLNAEWCNHCPWGRYIIISFLQMHHLPKNDFRGRTVYSEKRDLVVWVQSWETYECTLANKIVIVSFGEDVWTCHVVVLFEQWTGCGKKTCSLAWRIAHKVWHSTWWVHVWKNHKIFHGKLQNRESLQFASLRFPSLQMGQRNPSMIFLQASPSFHHSREENHQSAKRYHHGSTKNPCAFLCSMQYVCKKGAGHIENVRTLKPTLPRRQKSTSKPIGEILWPWHT